MEGSVIKPLSAPSAVSETNLFESKKHGNIVQKIFKQHMAFKRVVEALKGIDRSLHPTVLKIDMRRQTIYMSYQPLQTPIEDQSRTMAALLHDLHETTKQYKIVSDPGSGDVYPFWKEYMKKKVPTWLQTISASKYLQDKAEAYMQMLPASAAYSVSYIQGKVRADYIGEKKGKYLFLRFTDAIWGDPYWDVASYIVESGIDHNTFYKQYGVEEPERADAMIWLYHLAKAATLKNDYLGKNGEYQRLLSYLEQ